MDPTIIYLTAGDCLTCARLTRWLNEGHFGFTSPAGVEIVSQLQRLAVDLPCPLIIYNIDEEQYAMEVEWDTSDVLPSFIARTKLQLINGFLAIATPGVLSRIPRIPLSKNEVMERVRFQYETDENAGLLLLSSQGSVSCTLYHEWKLSRAIIKCTFAELSYDRRLQVALASVLTCTRFKYYDKIIMGGGICLPTQCRKC